MLIVEDVDGFVVIDRSVENIQSMCLSDVYLPEIIASGNIHMCKIWYAGIHMPGDIRMAWGLWNSVNISLSFQCTDTWIFYVLNNFSCNLLFSYE